MYAAWNSEAFIAPVAMTYAAVGDVLRAQNEIERARLAYCEARRRYEKLAAKDAASFGSQLTSVANELIAIRPRKGLFGRGPACAEDLPETRAAVNP